MVETHFNKVAARVTLPALVKIVNFSIRVSHFSQRWKFYVVVPHHKKGDKFVAAKFRPVFHLIELGRNVELVVWNQLL